MIVGVRCLLACASPSAAYSGGAANFRNGSLLLEAGAVGRSWRISAKSFFLSNPMSFTNLEFFLLQMSSSQSTISMPTSCRNSTETLGTGPFGTPLVSSKSSCNRVRLAAALELAFVCFRHQSHRSTFVHFKSGRSRTRIYPRFLLNLYYLG